MEDRNASLLRARGNPARSIHGLMQKPCGARSSYAIPASPSDGQVRRARCVPKVVSEVPV